MSELEFFIPSEVLVNSDKISSFKLRKIEYTFYRSNLHFSPNDLLFLIKQHENTDYAEMWESDEKIIIELSCLENEEITSILEIKNRLNYEVKKVKEVTGLTIPENDIDLSLLAIVNLKI